MSDNLRNIGENHPGTQLLKIEDPDIPALPRSIYFISVQHVYKYINFTMSLTL